MEGHVGRDQRTARLGKPLIRSLDRRVQDAFADSVDDELEALAEREGLREYVADTLIASGLERGVLVVVVVQSQETVDRDYEGSWFYAMR